MTLAQGERGPDDPEPVDLATVVREAADQHRGAAEEAGVLLDLHLGPLPALGDPVMLTRLVSNLIHNAVRYNHPGGSVEVRTSPAGTVSVRNTGPQVPTDRIPELFEPFRRLHTAHTSTGGGAGLGLSIVTAIAAAHGAAIDAQPNTDGGLTITVRLPEPGCVPLADQRPTQHNKVAGPALTHSENLPGSIRTDSHDSAHP
ncbi:HAMP domain-containing sensor histidine kinase [Streptomyces sp. NPDC002215]|uniref:sensor histidine kinase n=1 Tax=Streptomyces sp. NPDC002215 TaxID=3154412 RepID=UPI00331D5FF7